MFYGPIKGDVDTIALVKNYAAGNDKDSKPSDSAATDLYKFLDVRGIVLEGITKTSDIAALKAKVLDATDPTKLSAALLDYKGFILNQYPKVFTVNSVSVYVGPDAPDAPAKTT